MKITVKVQFQNGGWEYITQAIDSGKWSRMSPAERQAWALQIKNTSKYANRTPIVEWFYEEAEEEVGK